MNNTASTLFPSQYVIDHYRGSGLSYRSVVADIEKQIHNHKIRSGKILSVLRELCLHVQDLDTFNLEYLESLSTLVHQMKDNDNDGRKAYRLLCYHIAEMLWSLQNAELLSQAQIDSIYESILDDSSSYLPRRRFCLRTAGILGHLTSISRIDGGGNLYYKVIKGTEDIVNKVWTQLSGHRPTAMKSLKKAVLRDHQEVSVLSSGIATFIHRLQFKNTPIPAAWISCALALCSSEDNDASRSAFAGLGHHMIDQEAEGIAMHLHARLRPTADAEQSNDCPLNLKDTLASIYYLRLCAKIAFLQNPQGQAASKLTEQVKDDFYRTLVRSLHDSRLRVSLEAVSCILSGGGARSYPRLITVEARSRLGLVGVICKTLSQGLRSACSSGQFTSQHSILRMICLTAKVLREGDPIDAEISTSKSIPPATTPSDEQAFFLSLGAASSPSRTTSSFFNMTSQYQEEVDDLLKCIISLGTLQSSHRALKVVSLRAIVWLLPDPPTKDLEMWSLMSRCVGNAVQCLSDGELAAVLTECQKRLSCHSTSPASGNVLVRLLLQSVEHYVRYAPSDGTSRLAISTWDFLLKHHSDLSSCAVLDSVLSLLDLHTNVLETDASQNGRQDAVWEMQGASPPTPSETRGSLIRLTRLCCWFLGQHTSFLPQEQLGVVLLRLESLSLYADYLTRCAALSSLCKCAILAKSLDVKLAVYEYLHALEVAEFDLNICPDVKEEITSLWEVQGYAVDYFDQGGGLCMKDVITATIDHLESIFLQLHPSARPASIMHPGFPLQTTGAATADVTKGGKGAIPDGLALLVVD